MTIIDRYVLSLFAKVLCVCFGSLAGLYIVLETFNNLEEFIELGKAGGGMLSVLQSYFAPRLFSLFDRTSSLLAMVAAIFTLTWLQRTNELTAIMAGGISRFRVAKPLILAAITICCVAVINRELVIPHFGKSLVRNAQSWDGSTAMLHSRYDYQTGIFINGTRLIPREQKIVAPSFQLTGAARSLGMRMDAEFATYEAANDQHPAGYRFEKVTEPEELASHESVFANGELLVGLPGECDWLAKDEAFIASEVDINQLEVGDALQQFQSTQDVIAGFRNPSNDYGAALRRMAHNRLLQPFLDISLFLIGLPLVVSRGDRNIFVAAGACLGVIILYYGFTFFAGYLGDSGLLKPYQAAFVPLLVFAPWAAWALPRLDR